MTKKYTPEEQELIESLKFPGNTQKYSDRLAELLASKAGDMEFNAKLNKEDTQTPEIEILRYFTYKTRNISEFYSILPKLDIALALQNNHLPIAEYEKITLSEYGKIAELESLHKAYNGLLKAVYEKTTNSRFQELYTNIVKAVDTSAMLSKQAAGAKNYKSGDLVMYLTAKTAALKGKKNLSGHEGRLEEIFMTKYNHAAGLYIDNSDPNNPTTVKSDIWRQQRSDKLVLEEILQANVFRINPIKLVDKEQIKKLEKIDYGYKKDANGKDLIDKNGNKIRQTWQDVMIERYEELSKALYVGQQSNQITERNENLETLENKFEELNNLITAEKTQLAKLKAASVKLFREGSKLEANINKLSAESKAYKNLYPLLQEKFKQYTASQEAVTIQQTQVDLLEKELSDIHIKYKKIKEDKIKREEQIIENDQYRLTPLHWLNPKTIIEGHTQWFSKNKFRDLSQKMYNATPDQREMICSEFAARSIVSVMDQLNKITSIDLQAAGLIDKEKQIIHGPISRRENFMNLHPERLINILQKSGGIEKIENQFLKEILQLENTEKAKNREVKPLAALPNKIYDLVKEAKSLEDFKDKASKITDIYLKAANLESGVIKNVNDQIVGKALDEIYKTHTAKPETTLQKIGNVCIKILEFCKLLTKDVRAKKNINNMVSDITKEAKNYNMPNIQHITKSIAPQLKLNNIAPLSNNTKPPMAKSRNSSGMSI